MNETTELGNKIANRDTELQRVYDILIEKEDFIISEIKELEAKVFDLYSELSLAQSDLKKVIKEAERQGVSHIL